MPQRNEYQKFQDLLDRLGVSEDVVRRHRAEIENALAKGRDTVSFRHPGGGLVRIGRADVRTLLKMLDSNPKPSAVGGTAAGDRGRVAALTREANDLKRRVALARGYKEVATPLPGSGPSQQQRRHRLLAAWDSDSVDLSGSGEAVELSRPEGRTRALLQRWEAGAQH